MERRIRHVAAGQRPNQPSAGGDIALAGEPGTLDADANDDEEREAALNKVRAAVFAALHDLAKGRLRKRHRGDWQSTYTLSGRGSSLRRAGGRYDVRLLLADGGVLAVVFSDLDGPRSRKRIVFDLAQSVKFAGVV